MTRRRFRVTGTVQGVGFRYWVRSQALELRLKGSVRNLADGSVEVEVWGTEEAVDRMRTLLAEGPRHSDVKDVETLQIPEGLPPDNFEVTY